NVTSIVPLWLDDVINQRLSSDGKPLRAIARTSSWRGFIKTEDSGMKSWKTEHVWNVSDAWVEPHGDLAPSGAQDAGWLPSKRFADLGLPLRRRENIL